MILFALTCSGAHPFEGWFASGKSYEEQAGQGAIACPVCGDRRIRKAPMAPNLIKSSGGGQAAQAAMKLESAQAAMKLESAQAAMQLESAQAAMKLESAQAAMKALVERHFDDVGADFAEEARKIHYGEAQERPIRGEASLGEARDLLDEGILVLPLPWTGKHDA